MTDLRHAAAQALKALEAQHTDRLAYSNAKRRANATCGEFKDSPLSALIESGYMQSLGKQTHEAIYALHAALAAQPVAFDHDIGADRYQVVKGSFWWHVRIGDSTANVGMFHTKMAAEDMALKLLTAFRDGAFMQSRAAQPVAQEPRVCWLVEEFSDTGNSTGRYMQDQSGLTITTDAQQARSFRRSRTATFRATDMREKWGTAWRPVSHVFRAAQPQQAPLKERPDFVAGYTAGLADGRRIAERDRAEQPVAWREMIEDTKEVFDFNGAKTPQIVRDVIEYASSWLQVAEEKAAQPQQAAPP